MHKFSMPEEITTRVVARVGRTHPFDKLEASVKRRLSAFIQGSSDIALFLRSRGIDTVLIGGTATNVCCDVSARDAMMLNFKVIMVPDVLATWTDAEHNATLANFYSIFGDVQTCDEVLASLSRGQEATAA